MKTVIVVDDERATARVHADLLEVLGYSTIDFRSPAECIEWLGANRADIGLFDLCMPGINGVELLECLHGEGHRFPVVFLTGDPEGSLAREARQAGAAAIVGKPASMELLQRVMEAVRKVGIA